MARNRTSFPVGALLAALLVALVVVVALQPAGAGAITKQQVDAAKHHVTELKREIAQKRSELGALSQQLGQVSEKYLQEQDQLNRIQAQLAAITEQLQKTKAYYDQVVAELNARAHAAYIQGPGSNLAFILGATSLTDLSDRLEFVDAIARSNADLAQQVENTKNVLAASQSDYQKLEAKQAQLVAEVLARKDALQANFARQQQLLADIKHKEDQATAYAKKVSKQYQRQLQLSFGPGVGKGILQVCPVDPPRAFGDDFGAPRYTGGFHLHEGVDILAPRGTPIRAPFAGNAVSDYNTLGGNAVLVYGASGYVYNAHLDSYGKLGSVQAGDIIGYVGDTGDAQGGPTHDHFEWHPNVIPSNWPKSAYGYSVIGTAVNPYPLLVQACG